MRYSRQELYEQIGKEGQQQLRKKHVVIVGVGALGSVAAELLCRAGIGKLTLLDRDYVELHNLQRQSLYTELDVGQAKAEAAKEHLQQINSEIQIVSHVTDLHYENADLLKSDVVVDGTDNMETRFLMNEYCKKNKIPWIYGSAIRDEGYMKVYLPMGDCFACTFSTGTGFETCDTSGVLNSITHVIASLQVNEALKILLGKKVESKLVHARLWSQIFEQLETQPKKNCPVCQGHYTYLSGQEGQKLIKFCGSSHYQIRGQPVDLSTLAKQLKNSKNLGSCVRFGTMTIFPDGRVLILAKNEEEALGLYRKYLGT